MKPIYYKERQKVYETNLKRLYKAKHFVDLAKESGSIHDNAVCLILVASKLLSDSIHIQESYLHSDNKAIVEIERREDKNNNP